MTTPCSTPPPRSNISTPSAPKVVRVRCGKIEYNIEESPMSGIVKGTMKVSVSKKESKKKVKRKHSESKIGNPFAKKTKTGEDFGNIWPQEDLFNAKERLKKGKQESVKDEINWLTLGKRKKVMWFRNLSF
ncbi:unnamed protein product [Dimorphilus gyrociliatus]|uniref:Uncharacterized protein n=1 Tax=Dimorphilus gyrociliatus TaxID=2664684 RepID=A0A7I8VSL0_9ANNE|nr:unnamed protein product [Dimorphilus gyrociliatus]